MRSSERPPDVLLVIAARRAQLAQRVSARDTVHGVASRGLGLKWVRSEERGKAMSWVNVSQVAGAVRGAPADRRLIGAGLGWLAFG